MDRFHARIEHVSHVGLRWLAIGSLRRVVAGMNPTSGLRLVQSVRWRLMQVSARLACEQLPRNPDYLKPLSPELRPPHRRIVIAFDKRQQMLRVSLSHTLLPLVSSRYDTGR